jgi:hypothetical protein
VRIHGGHTAAEFAAKYRHSSLSRVLLCSQRRQAVAAAQCQGMVGYEAGDRHTAR